MTVISVIVGSTRQGRFSEKPAQWIPRANRRKSRQRRRAAARPPGLSNALLRPARAAPACRGRRQAYENEVVKKWTAEIARSDGFIFVAPEYNYGPSAVLRERARLGLSGVEPQGGRLCELWQCHGRSRCPAAPLDGDRASARSGPLVRSYCRDALGALPGRRCGTWLNGA